MYYVYLIRSQSHPEQTYIGFTTDFKQRLTYHNDEKSPHTSKYAPWRLEVGIAFADKAKAMHFESYLKVGSGYTFAKRHFW